MVVDSTIAHLDCVECDCDYVVDAGELEGLAVVLTSKQQMHMANINTSCANNTVVASTR
jgi:hypothetical protein